MFSMTYSHDFVHVFHDLLMSAYYIFMYGLNFQYMCLLQSDQLFILEWPWL